MPKIDLTTQGGRLKYLINSLNLTQVEFGRTIGQTKSVISRLINNKKGLTSKILHSIKLKYPAVNMAWLEHNTGNSGIEKEVKTYKEIFYIEKIANLEAENQRLKMEINQLNQIKS